MRPRLTGRWLIGITLAGAWWLVGCRPKAMNEPPPQSPASVASSADAALPAVPLERKGVIVPSDVKQGPAPQQATPSETPLGQTASPGAN